MSIVNNMEDIARRVIERADAMANATRQNYIYYMQKELLSRVEDLNNKVHQSVTTMRCYLKKGRCKYGIRKKTSSKDFHSTYVQPKDIAEIIRPVFEYVLNTFLPKIEGRLYAFTYDLDSKFIDVDIVVTWNPADKDITQPRRGIMDFFRFPSRKLIDEMYPSGIYPWEYEKT